MELRPPRWLTPLLGVVAAGMLAGGVAVAVAAVGGPWALWFVAALLLWGGATAAAIAVIGTRSVLVAGRGVAVTGVRGRSFAGDGLVGPLEQRLLGVRLTDGFDDPRRDAARALLMVRAHEALIALLQPTGEEPAPPALASVLEMARFEDPDPVTRTSGSGKATVLGPDGRPECRCCGVSMTSSTASQHDWPLQPGHCDGTFRAATRRQGDVLRGRCPACGLDGPLSYDGLVRTHVATAGCAGVSSVRTRSSTGSERRRRRPGAR